jgi:hypothetical protein
MEIKLEKINLGTFEVKDSIAVGDPCYGGPDFYDEAVGGKWEAVAFAGSADFWGRRTWKLLAFAAAGGKVARTKQLTLGVDSGQMAVFDADRFGEAFEDGEWYGTVCEATEKADKGGADGAVLAEGCVCYSGVGDGGYPATVAFDADGKVVSIEVDFGGEDDEDEDDGICDCAGLEVD